MQPERPVQTTLAFHASRIVIDAGVLLAMASMSLPFIESPGGERSALDADALPALLLLLPIFAVTLVPDHTRPLHPILGWSSLAFGLAALPYALVKMLDAGILADTLNGSVGWGARLLVIACVVSVVGIGIGLLRSLRGLPSGGTPGRTTAYRSGRRSAPTPTPDPIPTAVMASPIEAAADESPAPTGRDAAPPAGPPAAAASAAPSAAPSEAPAEIPPQPADPPPAGSRVPVQPEIVFPDTGSVAREARPDPVRPDDPFTTAERADAALDDHMDSMFDDEEDSAQESETSDDRGEPDA